MPHNGDQEQSKRRREEKRENALLRGWTFTQHGWEPLRDLGSRVLWSDEPSATEAGEAVRWEGKAAPKSWTCRHTRWVSRQHLQGRIHCSFWTKANQGPCAIIIIVRAHLTTPSVYGLWFHAPCWGQYLVQDQAHGRYSGSVWWIEGRLVYTHSSTQSYYLHL